MNADTDKWGAPHLWEDVLRVHQRSPMHACVGGGDQVYSVSPPSFFSEFFSEGEAAGCAKDAGLAHMVGKLCWVSEVGIAYTHPAQPHRILHGRWEPAA